MGFVAPPSGCLAERLGEWAGPPRGGRATCRGRADLVPAMRPTSRNVASGYRVPPGMFVSPSMAIAARVPDAGMEPLDGPDAASKAFMFAWDPPTNCG